MHEHAFVSGAGESRAGQIEHRFANGLPRILWSKGVVLRTTQWRVDGPRQLATSFVQYSPEYKKKIWLVLWGIEFNF